MSDASNFLRRASRIRSRALVVLLLAAGFALGGCVTDNAASNSYATANSGPTVAFESIDGPPPQVFDRMVNVLDTESKLRSLSIVSREGTAAYRVRSYLSAQVIRGQTVIAWVWDVYDNNQQRAARLSGEEPGGKTGRDAWAAADDMVLRKIAQAGFSGLSSLVNGTAPDTPAAAPSPAKPGPVVATIEPAATSSEAPMSALGYADHQ